MVVRGRWRLFLRAVLFALLLPLALSSSLPVAARALGGRAPHHCRCEVRGGHSTCACPICNPDRPEFQLSDASIRNRCGDDDEVMGATLRVAVLPRPQSLIEPASERESGPVSLRDKRTDLRAPPPLPPPRALLLA